MEVTFQNSKECDIQQDMENTVFPKFQLPIGIEEIVNNPHIPTDELEPLTLTRLLIGRYNGSAVIKENYGDSSSQRK